MRLKRYARRRSDHGSRHPGESAGQLPLGVALQKPRCAREEEVGEHLGKQKVAFRELPYLLVYKLPRLIIGVALEQSGQAFNKRFRVKAVVTIHAWNRSDWMEFIEGHPVIHVAAFGNNELMQAHSSDLVEPRFKLVKL